MWWNVAQLPERLAWGPLLSTWRLWAPAAYMPWFQHCWRHSACHCCWQKKSATHSNDTHLLFATHGKMHTYLEKLHTRATLTHMHTKCLWALPCFLTLLVSSSPLCPVCLQECCLCSQPPDILFTCLAAAHKNPVCRLQTLLLTLHILWTWPYASRGDG